MFQLLRLLEVAVSLTSGDGAGAGELFYSLGHIPVFAQNGTSQIEPLGFLCIGGAGHVTQIYVSLCQESSLSRSSWLLPLLPIPNHPIKVEVIFCVQAVVSPMLSNIYLHTVLDKWFAQEVRPRLKGQAFEIRFADDAVLVFAQKEDAERVMAVLSKRFEKYGLTINPEKTRMVQFSRPLKGESETKEPPRSDKFNFLGFTHYWGRSRKGAWVVMRKTEASRFTRALKKVMDWCKRHRHQPLEEQQRALAAKLRGHYSYYGITGNGRCLQNFRYQVNRIWHKWLSRRSRGQPMTWERFNALLSRYPLPPARVVHSCYTANL